MWDAPAFHHGPRPLLALWRARSASSPRARSLRALVTRRFHCRHSRQRSRRRRIQLSSSSSTPALWHRCLVWPLLTSAPASENLAILVASRHVCRSPRVLRTHLPAYARRIYDNAFRTCTGLCIFWPAYPAVPPLSASCSSRQRFASGFLPTPGHPRNRCLPLSFCFSPQPSEPRRGAANAGAVYTRTANRCSWSRA